MDPWKILRICYETWPGRTGLDWWEYLGEHILGHGGYYHGILNYTRPRRSVSPWLWGRYLHVRFHIPFCPKTNFVGWLGAYLIWGSSTSCEKWGDGALLCRPPGPGRLYLDLLAWWSIRCRSLLCCTLLLWGGTQCRGQIKGWHSECTLSPRVYIFLRYQMLLGILKCWFQRIPWYSLASCASLWYP